MRMIRIVTDSTADLTPSMIAEYGIVMIPLNVIIDGVTYADGIDLTKEQFYDKLKQAHALPTTSQASPAAFQDQFQQILDAGDDVYYIGLSSTLSGTLQSAMIGRDLLDEPERVTIFDSTTVTFPQGMLAYLAAQMAKEGKTAAEMTAALTDLRRRERLVFSVATLDNLRKSGRINNLSFLFGALLNIKPILYYDQTGVVQVYDKVRGKKNASQALLRYIAENRPDPAYPIAIGHTSDLANARSMEEFLHENGYTNTVYFEISGVVGTHVGAGTTGLFFFAQD